MDGEIKEWEIRRMPMKELMLANYNPRTISQKSFEGLGRSLDSFGLVQPIILNETTGNIVGGHQRYKALHKKGVEEVDVVIVQMNDTDEMACNIVLNSGRAKGVFTADVKDLLSDTEQRLNELFHEVGLNDLKEEIDKINFEKPDPPGEGEGSSSGSGDDDKESGEKIPEERIGIVCPRCSSVFKKKDNSIVRDET